MNKLPALLLTIICFSYLHAEEWLHFIPEKEKAIGKKIVFVTGDDEYKSETSMPMMAHILANHHGFECNVLFAINRKTGVIDTNQRDNIPGLHFLANADLMVIYTRFRTLVDDQMQMIENYLSTGKPVIGIRTATHAFDFSKVPDHSLAKYGYSNQNKDYLGGFGRQVLGETWIRHWGHHGKQSTRGRIPEGQEGHPILKGITDGEIWGPTDVYETALPQPEGCQAILLGEVCETMSSDSSPADGKKNNPMMPIAWTWNRNIGAKGRVFTSTIGGAMAGKDDWANEGMRRMFVNACYWTVKLEHKIPVKADVTPILQPNPFSRGVKPTEALEKALSRLEEKKRTILFYGNSMVERLLEHGELEARLQIAIPNQKLKIRSLAWTGDEVGNRLRLERYATHMNNLLSKWPSNTIVLGYGMNEAFSGEAGLDEFYEHYDIHIRQIKNVHAGAKIVLLSPIATNRVTTGLYTKAISKLAIKHGATFIDIHSITSESGITDGGIHLNSKGNSLVARKVATELLKLRGIQTSDPDPNHLIEVAKATSAKHFRVAEVVRPKNAVVYFGVRGRPYEYNGEMPRYHEMIRLTESVIYDICSNPALKFSEIPKPSLSPMGPGKGRDDGDRTGIIKTVAESEAEFKIADGYEVNLFASEEQFPELRNPVQITFDAKGRLWAVTMPSFPHTPPGLTPPDKIIILEDTDHDGKADKLTTFAEGLDALDGVAFHRNGIIISEQPRLWLMRDTNGDDIADTKEEVLRGIDVTDTHHGGMITTDPYGDIMFSDGVFHRSQLETPFGVVRGIDATTYRLNPITGRINTEWQHTTPNPWGITFDKWGNTFQVYGDGQVYDGSSLIWTPLGAYHPFRYAHICSYGKGSAVASVSSPNFPDRFKQAVASASLLGRYAVNLTAISYKDGMVKEVDHEAILSSPNAAFRPADVEFGMDGALYVSDFCSPIIGHAQHPMRDPHWDHDYGRIWRIVHTGKPIVKDWPKIEGAPAEELYQLLLHEQNIVRHHARIELRKIINSGTDLLDEWLKSISGSPKYLEGVLEVIFIREGLNQASPNLIHKLLKSDNPLLRGAGVQALRQQADRIHDIGEMLSPLVNDPHPRVQIEVIDAVAHLRQTYPTLDTILANIQPANKHVSDSLAYLDYGTEPAKGRSVPVLDVTPQSQLKTWQYLGENGQNKPVAMQLGRTKLPGAGLFRTFVHSKKQQSAIIAINHKNLKIRVNDVLKFSQNSLWSGDQQVNVELNIGLNVIEVQLNKGRRASGIMPPVYLYDPAGQVLGNTSYPVNLEIFKESEAEYEKMIAERGNLLFVQAAAGLQFSPTKMSVPPGSKVRLVFDNPDIMMHNWVLLKPGSLEEVGSLADKLAEQPDGMEKGYLPDTDKILVASKLLGPKAKQELVFTAPSEPGEYPYTCTFPGHWRIMKGILTVAKPAPPKKVTIAPFAGKLVTKAIGDGVMFETTSSPNGFKTLKLPEKPAGKLVTNRNTNNDPITILTDGKLSQGFGPVFANGIKNGTYRMDLGKKQPVSAITSWSFKQSASRGSQLLTIYGSANDTDPGWDFSDKKTFTNLGTISTKGQKIDQYTALSLRSKPETNLGNFRWIAWHVFPVTKLNENTAFQELAVEIGVKKMAKTAKPAEKKSNTQPNVILVMTDDQGWAEVGFNGNEMIQTPNLDKFAAEGLQLSQFYVSPMCTPTRSSLMTGRYHYRTGAHDTYIGRTNMNPQEATIAEMFADAGYRTGIFGKWHLGENYPMRAQDQGFHDVVVHGGGGLGQFADYPRNTNYSPILLYQDTYKKSDGYCTDVFIDESIRFIKENKEKPFFCYVPLNAPHAPFTVDQEYSGRYQGKIKEGGRKWTPDIYGMITQMDEAFQRLLDTVKTQGLEENTIVIFTTDNGPNSTYFTAGLKARKGSAYENGFRVPFVIRWPAAIEGGRKLNDPTMHIDLLPTLAQACNIPIPRDLQLDGQNILPLLTGEIEKLDERFIFMQHNRGNVPVKYKNGMARKGPWKVVGNKGTPEGFELYHIDNDPGETNNLAAEHPEKVKAWVAEYEKWFDDVTAELMEIKGAPHPFELNPAQPYDYRLTWQDWYGDKTGWNAKNYGKWHVTNPGLFDKFDITIRTTRDTYGLPTELRFIWLDQEKSMKFDRTPDQILLEDIKLKKGTGWMEAQLIINGKIKCVQEIQIRPHGVESVIKFPEASPPRRTSKNSKSSTTLPKLTSHLLPEEVKGQYVRIELPGGGRTLSLTEVMVYEKGVNKALNKKASQASIAFDGKPEFAVDGNTNGDYHSGSTTHTESARPNPWWEVDLGKVIDIDEIAIANRTDSNGDRLEGFTLKVLNAKREEVYTNKQTPQSSTIQFIKDGVKSSTTLQTKPTAKAKSREESPHQPQSNGPAHPLVYEGKSGPGLGKHIVFLANDHEYRSEQTCPAIARMLAKHHGFRCTVLFGLNDDGHIHPGGRTVPGLEALKDADMLFLFSRFMNLPDEQVDHLADYFERGGPVVALRTSSHSFNGQSGKWAKLNYNYRGDDYSGGLGQNIFGVTWTDNKNGGQGHYGGNHSQGSRITIAESSANHPILTGVGEMHGYSGAYSSPVPPGATSLIKLQVLNSFQPGGEPAKNKPIKTAGWYKDSYTAPSGTEKKARVVYTPFGASEDILDENMRRFLTNASFWALGMEKQITPDLEVSLVGKYRPSPYSTGSLYFKGVSPSQLAGWESAIMPANAELVGVDQQSEKGKQRIERIFKNRPEMAVDLFGHQKPMQKAKTDEAMPAETKKAANAGLPENTSGQYVRIELPGENRTLSLAEVQVFDQGQNLALGSPAIQSTIAFSGDPKKAVDGNVDGQYMAGSVTHTTTQNDPFWEVDFGKSVNIEEIVIYNRTDGHAQRLDGFTLKVLSPERKVVFEKKDHPQSKMISLLKAGVKSSQVALKSGPSKDSITKYTQGVGSHLFILAGQSNMVALDPDISFTPAVNEAFGEEKVIVFKDAHNSQSIRRWVKGWRSVQGKSVTNSGDLYDQLVEKVKAATEGKAIETVTLVWMQGEADAAGNQVGVYRSSLDRLLKQLKKDLDQKEIRFVLGRLSDYSLESNKHPEWQDMRDLQVAYAEATPLGAWVDTDDLNNKSRDDKPFNDVHYTKDGYRIFGQRLAQAAIEMLDPKSELTFPGEKSNFRGYVRYSDIKTEHGHFSVVCPKKAAPGRPWLWRSLFWEAIQQFSNADLKLVDEGYHIVLAHGDVAGHPKGNPNIDAAYEMLTTEYGFSKKCSMASMSRGTLSLFRWANSNPEKVESIYVDNGVCNVLSWPAGKLVPGNNSIANGAPASWEDFKKKYGYTSDAEALKTKENPIDLLEPLAKAGVPIITVCGNKDGAVPYEENDAILEQRYIALGGDIRVIVENKGHSHGMKDPTPVLEFIRKHTQATLQNSGTKQPDNAWVIDNDADWVMAASYHTNLHIGDGMATPTAKEATYRSKLKTFDKPRSLKSITLDQSPVWHNWEPINNLGPSNLGDAPVMVTVGPENYWMFGRYGGKGKKGFKAENAKLEGFDIPLKTTPFPNQYDAPGGLKPGKGGYHAWQSKDMLNWVHHGSVTESFSSWVTTAEYADGKLYIYYDYPNDQDPHLYIDDNLTDGIPGKNMGIAFKDPSHGSDCTFIRDLDGNFHVIYEDWSPINASKHSWDSPLAGHAISKDGIGNFKVVAPAVDERTNPTGRFAEYPHPHWHATMPEKFPAKKATKDVPEHRIKKGEAKAYGQYEIHEPIQDAFGDWASICIGGQYYLFADFHPANDKIRVGWFTSDAIDKPFTFCGEIGNGHPDPDIMFAEGMFYLATQQATDYISTGPWVETVEVRVGIDNNNDGKVNQWTDWQEVKESYDYVPGFSKQVAKTSASIDLAYLPEGYGFQFETRMNDKTENASKPILDSVTIEFGPRE